MVATYNRDYQAALTKAATATNANGNIYKKAQEVCAPQFSYWSQVYVQCTANEIAKYPASANLATAVSLPTDAYLYSFVSPVWSPDFAGWSLLISVVIFIMILVRLIGVAILRLILHYRYRGL